MNGASLENDSQQERRVRYERYLLGTLDEDERASVREAVIRDPDACAELREVELDLLDAAADGTIEPARKKLVEERLAADARNHAAALVSLALAEHRAAKHRKPAWRWAVALPAAAALVMATGLGLFLLRGGLSAPGERPGTSGSAGPDASDSPSAAALRSPDAALDTVPRPESGSPAGTEVPQGPPPAIAGSAPPTSGAAPGTTAGAVPNATAALPDRARTVALFLPAGTLRGARPSVRVPPSTETIRIELELDPPAPRHVDVTLRAVRDPAAAAAAPSASALWSAARVAVRAEQGQHVATIDVPARALPTGVVEVHVAAQSDASRQSPDSAAAPLRAITFLVRRD